MTQELLDELPKNYQAANYEADIYRRWEESGAFRPETSKSKKTFSIILPPPNVTGILHLGHASMLAYEDIMIRYHKALGEKVLWLPGFDHAAIATQNVVEKQLAKQKIRKEDLGRTKFLLEVEKFVAQNRTTIKDQLKSMGSALDWDRTKFTLDEDVSKTVRHVFKKMFDEGLIYRGYRMVNWCVRCQSTLADDEVEHQEQQGKMYYIKYGPFVIATTRPETKLADTGVAVNPEDERYQQYIGQEFDVDLAGHKVHIKVITDPIVDKEFGTGALGVTPAHSFVDYDLSQKYNLPVIELIDQFGRLKDSGGKYAGLKVKEAREKFVADLEACGQIVKVEDYQNNLSICYRCGAPVEPLPSKQWFVNVNKKTSRGKSLKDLARGAVKSNNIKIIPDRFNKTYFQWMDNLRDWCISRQIWYGHQLPVWHKGEEEVVVSAETPTQVFVLRHGLTDWNQEDGNTRIQGLTDVPIDESREKLVEELAGNWQQPIDLIVASPLIRSRQTAEIFAKYLKAPVEIMREFQERDYGVFEGQSIAEIKTKHPEYYENKLTFAIPEAETFSQVQDRARRGLEQLIKKYPGQRILVVTHTTVIRSLLRLIENPADRELTDFYPKFGQVWHWNFIKENLKKGFDLRQSTDTLDTWFSSSLWTFSTLGWLDQKKDFTTFHPTSVLETGYDILFFWVARMIMMTTYATGQVPFRTVYLHGLIRDKNGQKMSKSKGNGIDPVEMIAKFGADAARLSLLANASAGNDVKLYEEKIAGERNFVNKLWNIARFIYAQEIVPGPHRSTWADKWIMAELNQTVTAVTNHLEGYEFSQAIEALQEFTWKKLADWYLEMSKIEGGKGGLLGQILETTLKLWQPFIPFVTQAIWQHASQELLMLQAWPVAHRTEPGVDQEFAELTELVTAIRQWRAENNIDHKEIVQANFVCNKSSWLVKQLHLVAGLTKIQWAEEVSGEVIELAISQLTLKK
ncbi:MAG: class I tRNA ligase family protein [Candidatus Komeilibacteria bacterium]|nr:class I tRNA ligase family protein [Candidatus Komeilibacteria bacterium]